MTEFTLDKTISYCKLLLIFCLAYVLQAFMKALSLNLFYKLCKALMSFLTIKSPPFFSSCLMDLVAFKSNSSCILHFV